MNKSWLTRGLAEREKIKKGEEGEGGWGRFYLLGLKDSHCLSSLCASHWSIHSFILFLDSADCVGSAYCRTQVISSGEKKINSFSPSMASNTQNTRASGAWEAGVRCQGTPVPSCISFWWYCRFPNMPFSPCTEVPSLTALHCVAWSSSVPDIDTSLRGGAGLIPHVL